jgi:hypothetical protein
MNALVFAVVASVWCHQGPDDWRYSVVYQPDWCLPIGSCSRSREVISHSTGVAHGNDQEGDRHQAQDRYVTSHAQGSGQGEGRQAGWQGGRESAFRALRDEIRQEIDDQEDGD